MKWYYWNGYDVAYECFDGTPKIVGVYDSTGNGMLDGLSSREYASIIAELSEYEEDVK